MQRNCTQPVDNLGLVAVVWSKPLAVWRLAKAGGVLGSGERVYGTPVGNLLRAYNYGHFDLTDDARRRAKLPRMLTRLSRGKDDAIRR